MSGIIAQNSGRHTGLIKSASGGGAWNLIETLTADGSGTALSFTSGIDDTYDEYVFKFINIHPETDGAEFQFQGSIDSGSNYNVTITSSAFRAIHDEDDAPANVVYEVGFHLAQSTGFQILGNDIGNDNDQNLSGYLHVFNPSSDTFVKHFISTNSYTQNANILFNSFLGGYFNTTSALDAFQFAMSTGDMDAGTISLFGIS